MAVVGHPFFAGGHNMTLGDEKFARLKQLLLSRGVTILMAGDTHDLEYYVESGAAGAPAVHYFVNGGGGAYMSFGTALSWPAQVPVADWAHYPDRRAVGGEDRSELALVETAGLVVDHAVRRVAVFIRMAVGDV